MKISAVLDALAGRRFSLEDEKRTQLEIEAALAFEGVVHTREVLLVGPDNERLGVVDFLIGEAPAIALEIKIKGQAAEIRRQLERYARSSSVEILMLATAKRVALPGAIAGKPVITFDLARAWL